MSTYFAEDGNFGSAEGMTIIDTSDWYEDAWNIVCYAGDPSPALAKEVAYYVSTGRVKTNGSLYSILEDMDKLDTAKLV